MGPIQRRALIRNFETPQPEIDQHALAWSRISRALLDGRNPSVADLLAAIAADTSIPENVQIYAQWLRSGEVKPTAGPKPKWNLNHDAWQRVRDVILVERFEALKRELIEKRHNERLRSRTICSSFEVRKWGGARHLGRDGRRRREQALEQRHRAREIFRGAGGRLAG